MKIKNTLNAIKRWIFSRDMLFRLIAILVVACLSFMLVKVASQSNAPIFGDIKMSDLELAPSNLNAISTEKDLDGYTPVAESADYIMFVSETTTNVALYNKITETWNYSFVPESELEKHAPENEAVKSEMESNFILKATDLKTGSEIIYSSSDVIEDKTRFSIQQTGDGVVIHYIVGEVVKNYIHPTAMLEARYEEILELVGDEAKSVRDRYRKIDIKSISGDEKKAIVSKYPVAENEVIYIFRDNAPAYLIDKLSEILENAGYTDEDRVRDEQEIGVDAVEAELPRVMKLSMKFSLRDNIFSVSIDKANILNSSRIAPKYIDVLPYFLTGTTEDNGYMLIPDGTGAVINLNNGNINSDSYSGKIYGDDPMKLPIMRTEELRSVYLPIYAIKTAKHGIFAHISEGAAEGYVKANISGKNSASNHIYSGFDLRVSEQEVVYRDWAAGASTVYATRVQAGELKGNITIDYHLLSSEKSEFQDMAQIYRDILGLEKSDNSNDVLLDILGAYDAHKSVLGIPVQSNIPMTTYSEAEEILAQLSSADIPLKIRYLSAVNGGYLQSVSNGVKFQAELGGAKAADKFIVSAKSINADVFFDISLTQVYKNKLFDGFSNNLRTMNLFSKYGKTYDLDPVLFYFTSNERDVLAPSKLENISSKLFDSVREDDFGIAYRHLGSSITSDFNRESAYFRSDTVDEYEKLLEAAKTQDISGMYSGGNEYVIKNASHIADLPVGSSNLEIADYSIPFYQMVVAGYVPFSYHSVNESNDPISHTLVSLATGAQISATVSYKDASLLKQTDYSRYYYATFETSLPVIKNCYDIFNEVKEKIGSGAIKSYDILEKDVTKTVFEGGKALVVNTSSKDYDYDGKIIKPQNWLVLEVN